jgi:cardiolipin synthase
MPSARRSYLLLRGLFSIATLTLLALLAVVLFEPGLAYTPAGTVPAADSALLQTVLSQALEQAPTVAAEVTLLEDGAAFYQNELAQISTAKTSVHLEAFIFHRTAIGQRFMDALVERARAGVKVRVVIDAVGSLPTSDHFFDPLRAAGGQVVWYQPFRWYTLKRWNNRTHRELLIVDHDTAWIGGAGIGSAWDTGTGSGPAALPAWRDLMVRVSGPVASALDAVFAQSWLEASGEILLAPAPHAAAAPSVMNAPAALVVSSTPTGGRATRGRLLFALMVASARHALVIDSPYFVPDPAMRRALTEAAQRGVQVTVITPGAHNNHLIARLASRRHYGELIASGVRIFEYQPGMIHTKLMLVDGLWSIVGSTNFDNRSMGLNNEVNLLLRDPALAEQFQRTVAGYLSHSRQITLEEWAARPAVERAMAWFGSVLERQE